MMTHIYRMAYKTFGTTTQLLTGLWEKLIVDLDRYSVLRDRRFDSAIWSIGFIVFPIEFLLLQNIAYVSYMTTFNTIK